MISRPMEGRPFWTKSFRPKRPIPASVRRNTRKKGDACLTSALSWTEQNASRLYDLVKWPVKDRPFVQELSPPLPVIAVEKPKQGGFAVKTKLAAILILVAILMPIVAGCSSAGAAADVPRNTHRSTEISIDELAQNKQVSRTVEMNKGDTLTLTVGSNPTTGFSWAEQTVIGDAAIIAQTQHEFIQPTSNAVGAAGKDVWTFQALKSGTTQISSEYSRPWVGGEKAEWTIAVKVTVK